MKHELIESLTPLQQQIAQLRAEREMQEAKEQAEIEQGMRPPPRSGALPPRQHLNEEERSALQSLYAGRLTVEFHVTYRSRADGTVMVAGDPPRPSGRKRDGAGWKKLGNAFKVEDLARTRQVPSVEFVEAILAERFGPDLPAAKDAMRVKRRPTKAEAQLREAVFAWLKHFEEEGMRPVLAAVFGVSETTVSRWRKHYRLDDPETSEGDEDGAA